MQGFKSWNLSIVMIVKLFSVHCQIWARARIFKIFVAKQLLFRPFGIFIKHIGWKILLTQENPKFSVTERVNLSFLIFPSTEFDFFNFFSILTSPRIPGNQNLRLLISFLLLFQNIHSELGVNYIPHSKVLSSIRGHSKTN